MDMRFLELSAQYNHLSAVSKKNILTCGRVTYFQ